MFSLFLTRPHPQSVFLTMPGSRQDLHLPLCFLNRCFPLWFFLFFKKSLLTIDLTPIQTNKSTRTPTCTLPALENVLLPTHILQGLYPNMVMLYDFDFTNVDSVIKSQLEDKLYLHPT